MKIRELTCVLAVSVGVGCSSSNNTPSFDAAVEVAKPTDTATEHVVTPTDGPAPGTTTQKLAVTIIATDQIGGDGGLEVGPTDGGADAVDAPGVTVDPNLVNPWGLAFNPAGPLWVADNHAGVSTIYDSEGRAMSLVVTVPVPDGGTPPSAPTGLVFNASATAFLGDKFIFSSEDGTLSGWQAGTAAVLRVDASGSAAIYKGLAIATVAGVGRLYATDFHNGKVDVFDQTYAKVTPVGGFTDPSMATGFAPFGVQVIGTTVYVTYAKQDDMKEDDVQSPGNGYLDAFDLDGTFTRRVVSQGVLNSPWAVVLAPSDFGAFSNALLVGNFGDGHINAYTAAGVLLGEALTTTGATLKIDGLWALVFGNDTAGEPHNRLFFTAGPHDEDHGLLGHLDLP